MGDLPRLVIHAAEQRIVVGGDLMECGIRWPGVPGDVRIYSPRQGQDDLFSAFDHAEVSELLQFDDWSEDDDGDGTL